MYLFILFLLELSWCLHLLGLALSVILGLIKLLDCCVVRKKIYKETQQLQRQVGEKDMITTYK